MRDFTADHISTEEATKLLATMQEYVTSDPKFAARSTSCPASAIATC